MDEQLVLTAQTLRLNPHVLRAGTVGTAFVVKNAANRKYLTVTAEQWNLLRNFVNPATVPDVLRAVILNRTCLPLREYYELVLKALRAGVLLVDRQPEGENQGLARRWLLALGPRLPLILTWVSVIAALVFDDPAFPVAAGLAGGRAGCIDRVDTPDRGCEPRTGAGGLGAARRRWRGVLAKVSFLATGSLFRSQPGGCLHV